MASDEDTADQGAKMNADKPQFTVMYLGSAILDRRYPPQYVMPWVMAEVKRRKSAFQEVTLEVMTHVLRATKFDSEVVLFEHKLTCMTRFAKTHQDPRCFAYLSRQNLYCDFECHVFLAHSEEKVPELFSTIQEATRRDLFSEDMGETKNNEPAKAFYEVLYLGRAKLATKKITCNHVDELCKRLEEKEQQRKKKKEENEKQRKRHGSGVSVQSLPASLENSVSVTENELEKQHEQFKISGTRVESPCSSADELSSYNSSSENVLEHSTGLSNSGGFSNSDKDSKEDLCEFSHKGDHVVDSDSAHKELHVHFSDPHENICDPNRTMLFRLGGSEISLISLDKKLVILDRRFKDISSVSQGKEKSDVFGFIAREKGNLFICHLMKCHSCSIVDEIMMVLRSAFQSAYEQNRQQICIMCPLHQLHRLCQEINGLTPQDAYKRLLECLHNLPEKDTLQIYTTIKAENPQSYEENVEVLMIELRKLCEAKQQEHTHISDNNKSKSEFNILENRRPSAASAFDNLRNKCKKSLTTSFENLISKVPHKKPNELRDRFRHRSGTTESESSFSRSVDSPVSTPDCSPMPSPAVTKEVHFNFPSPPSSPKLTRPRSSTVGALPDATLASRFNNTSHLDKSAEFKEHAGRRGSTNSPMKQMFLLSGSGGTSNMPKRRDSTTPPNNKDEDDAETPKYHGKRRGSWRQAIFNRVVTPARTPDTPTVLEKLETETPKSTHSRSPEQLRSLWKKAILQTLLLLRIEKEKQDIKARQNETQQIPVLDYEEVTPCLREVTKVWEDMISDTDRPNVQFNPQTLQDCVRKGVPKHHRGDIWWLLTEQHRLHYPGIQEQTPNKEYNELLKDLTEYQHNILIDLGRTFPGHPYFSAQLGPGQLSLYNLLKAYSLLDKDVGYCQGLSFIAGILLMHINEVKAFETLRHMMFNLGLRKQFQPNMMPLQIQLYQLTRLIHDNYKDLHDHFEEHEIAPNLYATPWFLTLFASQFPLGFVSRVFDLLLMQGVEVLLKVALVLLGNHKELILQCDSFETIVEFIKTTLPEMGVIQMERVINQVFDMEIGKQLQAYEVEYHVLREEMIYSPQKQETDTIQKLEGVNQSLKNQNIELLEKLQQIHSHHRSLEITIHNLQTNESKLKNHIKTLELERKALLNAVTKLRTLITDDEYLKLDISLPPLSPSLPSSPSHPPNSVKGTTKKAVGKSLSSPLIEDRNIGSKQFQFE